MCIVHVHVYMYTYIVYVCLMFQLSESEGEVSGKNKQLATLSAELAQEREGLEQEERQEGQ